MSLALCFQQPQGQDRRPLPREDGGLRAGKAKELGRERLPEKKDTGETKGKPFIAESILEKSISRPRTLGCPCPGIETRY